MIPWNLTYIFFKFYFSMSFSMSPLFRLLYSRVNENLIGLWSIEPSHCCTLISCTIIVAQIISSVHTGWMIIKCTLTSITHVLTWWYLVGKRRLYRLFNLHAFIVVIQVLLISLIKCDKNSTSWLKIYKIKLFL